MNITIKRYEFGEDYTIGRLYINDVFECFTLEDKVRPTTEPKVPGKTAIPTGTYKVIVDFSNRFQQLMPHILNVSNFEGVRIHSGNTDKDTEGCILVGQTKTGKNFIGNSKKAYASLFKKINEALAKKEVIILTLS